MSDEKEIRINELEVALEAQTRENQRLKAQWVELGGGAFIQASLRIESLLNENAARESRLAGFQNALAKAEAELESVRKDIGTDFDFFRKNKSAISRVIEVLRELKEENEYGPHD